MEESKTNIEIITKTIICGILYTILAIMMLFFIGIYKVDAQAYSTVDFIIYSGNWNVISQCTNSTVCTAYKSSSSQAGLDVRHFLTIIDQQLIANQSYTIDLKINYSVWTADTNFDGINDMGGMDFQLRNGRDTFVERPTCLSGDTINKVVRYEIDENDYIYFSVDQHYTCTFKTTQNANQLHFYQTFDDVAYSEGDVGILDNPTINATTTNQDVVDKIGAETDKIIINQDKNTNEIKEAIKGNGLNEETKKPANKDKYENTHNKEEQLLDEWKPTDEELGNIDLEIEQEPANYMWNLLERILNTNERILYLVMSILVVGVIKLIMGR